MFALDTPHGQADIHLHAVERPRGALVLGHGAGGGVGASDLVAVTRAALSERISVALVEQPYRVAGHRSPPPAHKLDASWATVVEHLRSDVLGDLPLVVGGRSSGARVACRTAEVTGAAGVLCLAFPLLAPRRATAKGPPKSRLEELVQVVAPVLVVQGERDRFGIPPSAALRKVVQVPGDHSLRSDPDAVAAAVRGWLADVLSGKVGPPMAVR